MVQVVVAVAAAAVVDAADPVIVVEEEEEVEAVAGLVLVMILVVEEDLLLVPAPLQAVGLPLLLVPDQERGPLKRCRWVEVEVESLLLVVVLVEIGAEVEVLRWNMLPLEVKKLRIILSLVSIALLS